MPISQAQNMLQQLQQQMSNPNFGSQFIGQLNNAGLGAQNPVQFYGTPLDEQFLRQAVMGRVLGFYGMPMGASGQYNNIGNPNAILGGRMNIDPFSGGMNQMAPWAQAGFNDKAAWKQAGRPEGFLGGPQGLPTEGGNPMQLMPYSGGGNQGGQFQLDGNMGFGGGGNFPSGSGNQFYDLMNNYNPQIGALNQDYPGMFAGALDRALNQGNGMSGGGGQNIVFNPNFGGGGIGLPPIDQGTQNNLNQMYNAQLGNLNLDFDTQKQDMINQLYGRGVNASTIAADTSGRLNYGRQQAINQLFAQKAQNQIDIQKALLDAQTARMKSGGGGGIPFFNTGGGSVLGDAGGVAASLGQELSAMGRPSNDTAMNQEKMMTQGLPPGFSNTGAPPNSGATAMNYLQARTGGNSPIPLNFEQQMQLAQLQLQQQQLAQQGQLGFGGLGLQQQLGLGSQYLQGQGLSQDFMGQLLGMGLNRQQGAANFNQNDLARMQQYLQSQNANYANIGQQQAQLEAQRRSFWQQLALAGIGGASSLFSGMASGGTGFFR